MRTRAISANIRAMTDEFDQRLATGGSQVAVGMATANPLKVIEGVGTILGLETNNSATQRYVAAEYETFVFDELLELKGQSATAEFQDSCRLVIRRSSP